LQDQVIITEYQDIIQRFFYRIIYLKIKQ